MPSKRCFKCLQTLPLESFYKHAQMGDGHLNKCKECSKKDVIENRLARLDYYRSYDKRRASVPHRVRAREQYQQTAAGKRAIARARKKYKERYPERYKAKTALGNAVRDGRVERLPCFVCGGNETHGHHPDYSSPLDVVWLCRGHHRQAHAVSE